MTKIFADPGVQLVFETLDTDAIGDYQKGCRAFMCGKPRDYTPDLRTTESPTFDDLAKFYKRVETWEKGYDEAAKDPRYVTLYELARKLQSA